METPASKRSTKYHMSYGQIRYLMKRLSTALDSKLKQGRPPKYSRMCHRELRKLIGNQLERMPLEKKYMKGKNWKLEEFDPPTYSLGEDDESDSLQQSSGSNYAPSQLQQNNFGSRYTQSQLGSGSMFKTF